MTVSEVNAPVEARLLIAGELVDGASRLEVHNPARPDEVVGTIVRGTPELADRAVRAARAAFPAWRALGFRGRAALLAAGFERVKADIESRANVLSRENGKTVAEARGELSSVAGRAVNTLALAEELEVEKRLSAPSGRTIVGYRPYGVVLSIVPWNAPIALAFNQISSALLAGNTVVLKPPETAPLALIATIELFASALPPGVVNIITGLPGEIGDALTLHPDVNKIGFTGSIGAANHIMGNAAKSIKGITLELGGNDAAIILDDFVPTDAAMGRFVEAVFGTTGQICMAIKRVYVPEAKRDTFVDALVKAASSIVVGDGLDPQTTMGPLHTKVALDRATGLLAESIRQGGQAIPVGAMHVDAKNAGFFIQPHIVVGLNDASRLVVEEQFCPLLPILTYTDLDDAFARANDTVFGLGGSVWTSDVDRGLALAERFESGTVFVNTHGTRWVNRNVGYGGVKQSGIGRKAGLDGVQEYLQSQSITSFEDAKAAN